MSDINSNVRTIYEVIKKNQDIQVPFFQRQYVWDFSDQVLKLIEDVEECQESSYFLGTVIFKVNEDRKHLIIDGQQRLTTILLITRVIYDSDKINNENKWSLNHLITGIDFESFNVKNKTILINIFRNNINKLSDDDKQTNYYKNYLKIKDHFKNYTEDEITDFYNKLFHKTSVVEITIKSKMNENVVFSKVNSTGQELTAYDMFKNDLLASLIKDYQSNNYSESQIEEEVEKNIQLLDDVNAYLKNNSKVNSDKILRSFIAWKTSNIVNKRSKDIFNSYLNLKNNYTKINELFQDYIKFAVCCKFYLNSAEHKKYFNYQLVIIEPRFYTYLVLLVSILQNYTTINDDYKIVINDKNGLTTCFKILELYIISREFTEKDEKTITRAIPSFANELYKDILDKDLNYEQKLYYVLISNPLKQASEKKLSYAIPTELEFVSGFKNCQIYSRNAKFTKAFLVRLLTNDTKINYDFNNVTIEHVWPQTDSLWQDGNNLDIEKYKHTIGNLTLTAYNSEYSNSLFHEKKQMMLEKDEFKFNTYFTNIDKWDIGEIRKRSDSLYELTKKIWDFSSIDLNKLTNINVTLDTENVMELEEKETTIRKNKSYFNQCNITYDVVCESIRLYFEEKLSQEKIEKKLFNKSFNGWITHAILKYFGLSKNDNINFYKWINSNEVRINQFVDTVKRIRHE